MSRNVYDATNDTLTPITGAQGLDSSLSTTSENAIQNKAVTNELNKAYKDNDTSETDIANDDYVPFYDTSASAKRKSTWSNIVAKIKAALGIASSGSTYLKKDGTWGTPTNTTYTFATGDSDGQIKVTPSSGTAQNVSVKGLQSAAYSYDTDFIKYYGWVTNGASLASLENGTYCTNPNAMVTEVSALISNYSFFSEYGTVRKSSKANYPIYEYVDVFGNYAIRSTNSGGAWVVYYSTSYKDSTKVSKSGDTMTGTLILSRTQDASGTANNKPALIVGGTDTQAHLEFDSNEIMAKNNGTTTAPLHLNTDGGLVYANSLMVARCTSAPTSGQVMISDGTEGKIKSSGYTIAKSVPSDAKFSDTTYSAGTGLGLNGTSFYIPIPRVAESANSLPGEASVRFREYTAGANYNLPSNNFYQILETQSTDTNYGVQLALGMTTEAAYYRKYQAGWGSWKSLINTWRGIQNNLTSTSTTDSLSAAQGKVLQDSKVAKAGDTMSGNLTVNLNDGTTSVQGYSYVILGNNKAAGAAGNSKGYCRLYSAGTGFVQISAATTTGGTYNQTLPARNGTIANTDLVVAKSGDEMTGDLACPYIRAVRNNDRDYSTVINAQNKSTTTASAVAQIGVGNGTAKGTIGNCKGQIAIFSDTAYAILLNAQDVSALKALYLPASGTALATSASSSARVKENIRDMTEDEAKKILDIDVVKFDYKEEYEDGLLDQSGVIAEEVLEIIPEVVNIHPQYDETKAIDPASNPSPTVDYGKFAPYLIKMIQMQQERIEALEQRIESLESNN